MLYKDEFLAPDPKACKRFGSPIGRTGENIKELSGFDDKSAI